MAADPEISLAAPKEVRLRPPGSDEERLKTGGKTVTLPAAVFLCQVTQNPFPPFLPPLPPLPPPASFASLPPLPASMPPSLPPSLPSSLLFLPEQIADMDRTLRHKRVSWMSC